jgi:hypothetical protein
MKRTDKGFKINADEDGFAKSISLFEVDAFYAKLPIKYTHGNRYVLRFV